MISLREGDDLNTAILSMGPPDRSDFDEFYLAHFESLTIQLFAYTMDLAASEEAVQEAFCRALATWKKLTRHEDPVAWVRRTAWGLVGRRHRRGAPRTGRRDASVAPQLAQHLELARALSTLPATQRRVVILHYLADLPVSEIARQEGVAESTAMSSLNRGRAALAAQLDRMGERS